MRVLVDECVDWRIVRDLREHEARTVKQVGWESIDDGELLTLAATAFDVFLTVDKDLPREHDIVGLDISVIVLRARTTRLGDLRELLPALHDALKSIENGELRVLTWRDLR